MITNRNRRWSRRLRMVRCAVADLLEDLAMLLELLADRISPRL